MIPTWFPWLIIGGLFFILLGWLSHQWKIRSPSSHPMKPYRAIQSLQDFIIGAILIACVGISLPDLFPSWSDMEAWIPTTTPTLDQEDDLLQVGPPRLFKRLHG